VKEFSIGEIKINEDESKNKMLKLFLFAKLNENSYMDGELNDDKDISLHGTNHKINDRGIKVNDKQCWIKMLKFFFNFNTNISQIQVEKKAGKGLKTYRNAKTIGELTIL
jgi:hypothetical protein